MIDIIITSFREPKTTVKAVKTFLEQKISNKFRITVVDPFPEVEVYLKKEIKNKNVRFFLDPGEGKSYALNLLLQEYASQKKDDIFIFTDGDVFVSKNSVFQILKKFEDKKVGCVTGKPVALDERNNKYGLWAQIVFAGIDKVRKKRAQEKKFFECSGYLFAIRKGVILDFPLETSEDSIIPYLFWKKGYRVEYANKAEVYVKNPSNWKDYLAQKVRNIKAHENLNKIAPNMPRTKSLWNEIKEGAFYAILQPKNIREFLWTIELYFARLYIYLKAFYELSRKKTYQDGWRGERITESTKIMD
ncbi:glycosyltransferase [Candidatus Pacearchaeota archaeon]|nr:glycosyltransferase [Candidatus Pacearchaeota archaeon]